MRLGGANEEANGAFPKSAPQALKRTSTSRLSGTNKFVPFPNRARLGFAAPSDLFTP
jgi:hypothetical protein